MDTSNPVSPTAFVGIDPDDTLEVQFSGGTFTLGVLPVGLWDRFSSRSMVTYMNAYRRAIAKVKADGRDPDEKPKGVISLAELEVTVDETFLSEMSMVRIDALKYGLRGHANFKTKKREVPFTTVEQMVEGVKVMVVDEATLKFYRAQKTLVEALWGHLRRLHDLEADEKKV